MRCSIPLGVAGLLVAVPVFAAAVSFSDVVKTGAYADSISELAEAGIITGNPDGTFLPHVPLNRASFLAMTYRAANITPAMPKQNCFSDVPVASWFAPSVCDAARQAFVKGYADGTFKPDNMVSLAEAAKITFEVLHLAAPAVNGADVQIVPYNISPFAWYAPYIVAATRANILPLPDQGTIFRLNDPIERQEAAVLLARAWKMWNSSSASSVSSSEAASSSSSSAESSVASSAASSSAKALDLRTFPLPGTDTWQMSGTEKVIYRFTLTSKNVLDIDVLLNSVVNSGISCRLYHLQDQGMAPEYYWGLQEGKACTMRVALGAGNYQLELQSPLENAPYLLKVTQVTGDNNDGLVEASTLPANLARTSSLASHDMEDWYTFSVSGAPDAGLPYSIDVTSSAKVDCIINPWTDVVVFGQIPSCNQNVMLTNGRYYVRVRHMAPSSGQSIYTIVLRTR